MPTTRRVIIPEALPSAFRVASHQIYYLGMLFDLRLLQDLACLARCLSRALHYDASLLDQALSRAASDLEAHTQGTAERHQRSSSDQGQGKGYGTRNALLAHGLPEGEADSLEGGSKVTTMPALDAACDCLQAAATFGHRSAACQRLLQAATTAAAAAAAADAAVLGASGASASVAAAAAVAAADDTVMAFAAAAAAVSPTASSTSTSMPQLNSSGTERMLLAGPAPGWQQVWGLRQAGPLAWSAGILGCTTGSLYRAALVAVAAATEAEGCEGGQGRGTGDSSTSTTTSSNRGQQSGGHGGRQGRRALGSKKGSQPATRSKGKGSGSASVLYAAGGVGGVGGVDQRVDSGLNMVMQGLLAAAVEVGGRADLGSVRKLLGLTQHRDQLDQTPAASATHPQQLASTGAGLEGAADAATASPDAPGCIRAGGTAGSETVGPQGTPSLSDVQVEDVWPEEALQRCYGAWLRLARRGRPSGTQMWVLRALRRVPGVDGAAEEVQTADGLFSIDIVCRWVGVRAGKPRCGAGG